MADSMSDDNVIQSVEDFLHEQDKLFYQTRIQKLQKRWIKYNTLKFMEIM